MALFDNEEDFDRYFDKRILQMDNLENRELFKEILSGALKGLFAQTAFSYQELERRVFREAPRVNRMPDIYTGVCPKILYDATEKFLFPMFADDLEEKTVAAQEMLASVKKNQPFYLYTCFVQEDFLELQKLISSGRVFRGTIENEFSETPAEFVLRPNEKYLKLIEELYPIAWLNVFPWRSINSPYLYKFFDVYVTKIEEWDDQTEVKKVTVNFEEYQENISSDIVPLWNISPVTIKANAYPQPVLERSYFEHFLYKAQFKENHAYLLRHVDWIIRSMRWTDEGDLYIICDKEMPEDWNFYEVTPESRTTAYGYPLFNNFQDESFSRNMIEHFGQRIKTRTELYRMIESFNCSAIFDLVDAKPVPLPEETETYSVEQFVSHEFRSGNWNQALEISFRPKYPDFYLNRDIASFLVTNMQHFFPEFKCVGKLV